MSTMAVTPSFGSHQKSVPAIPAHLKLPFEPDDVLGGSVLRPKPSPKPVVPAIPGLGSYFNC